MVDPEELQRWLEYFVWNESRLVRNRYKFKPNKRRFK